jgi:hypothetical protein
VQPVAISERHHVLSRDFVVQKQADFSSGPDRIVRVPRELKGLVMGGSHLHERPLLVEAKDMREFAFGVS